MKEIGMEPCCHCNGSGYRKIENKIDKNYLCEYCEGKRELDYIENIFKKPSKSVLLNLKCRETAEMIQNEISLFIHKSYHEKIEYIKGGIKYFLDKILDDKKIFKYEVYYDQDFATRSWLCCIYFFFHGSSEQLGLSFKIRTRE